jgi:hypothetical protein
VSRAANSEGSYPGSAVLGMAIRDEAPLIAPYPDEFYRE